MVNPRILSRHKGALPSGEDRLIQREPLYDATEVVRLTQSGESDDVLLWTRKCIADVEKLELKPLAVAALIREAVIHGKFLQSEWCQGGSNGPWAACDAYTITRMETVQALQRELSVSYYVKFCIGANGKIMIVASCHLEEPRRNR